MTLQPDIVYVPYCFDDCFDGTAAKKVQPRRAPVQQPRRTQVNTRRRKKTIVRIDPVAVLATAVACVMLICMAVGMMRLGSINAETAEYEAYTMQLEKENAVLQAEYHENYDAEDVRQKALAMGMIPKAELEPETIRLHAPVEQETPGFLEQVGTFLAGLFA